MYLVTPTVANIPISAGPNTSPAFNTTSPVLQSKSVTKHYQIRQSPYLMSEPIDRMS